MFQACPREISPCDTAPLFALDRIGGGLVEPADDFGAHLVDHESWEDEPETTVDGRSVCRSCMDGMEIDRLLGDDPQQDQVWQGIMTNVVKAGKGLDRPCAPKNVSTSIEHRNHATQDIQYKTVLLTVMTAALNPISRASAPRRPPIALSDSFCPVGCEFRYHNPRYTR